jgi:hypothetical protein
VSPATFTLLCIEVVTVNDDKHQHHFGGDYANHERDTTAVKRCQLRHTTNSIFLSVARTADSSLIEQLL